MIDLDRNVYVPVARATYENVPAAVSEARGLIRTTVTGLRSEEAQETNVLPSLEPGVDIDIAVLVVSEGVTNAVTHTHSKHVTVGVGVLAEPNHPERPGNLVILVGDEESPKEDLTPTIATPEDLGGRGLSLIDSLTTDWGFVKGAKIYPPRGATLFNPNKERVTTPHEVKTPNRSITNGNAAPIKTGKTLVTVVGPIG